MRDLFSYWSCCVALVGLSCVATLQAKGSQDLPAADEVLRHLAERTPTPTAVPPPQAYECKKQTVTEEFDPDGRVTKRKVNVRQSRSTPSGANDANKWGSENGIALDQDLLRRYRFTVIDKENLNGRPAYVLTFVPKEGGLPVRRIQDRLLNRAVGTIWVDAADYELVKASICLGEPVSFGILGAVDSLKFAFERARAEEGGWLTSSTETFFKGRKFLKSMQFKKLAKWTDFKRVAETPSD